jgi:hypothetical protein
MSIMALCAWTDRLGAMMQSIYFVLLVAVFAVIAGAAAYGAYRLYQVER